MTTIGRWCGISELSGWTTVSGKPRGSGRRGVDGRRSLLFPSPRNAGEPTGRSEGELRNSPGRYDGRARTRPGVFAHRRNRRCPATITHAAADVFVNKTQVRVMLIMLRSRRAHPSFRTRECPTKRPTASQPPGQLTKYKEQRPIRSSSDPAYRMITTIYGLSQLGIFPHCHVTEFTPLDDPSLA